MGQDGGRDSGIGKFSFNGLLLCRTSSYRVYLFPFIIAEEYMFILEEKAEGPFMVQGLSGQEVLLA